MFTAANVDYNGNVALLAEGVDRNSTGRRVLSAPVMVVLLAEGVDRNIIAILAAELPADVALLAEGVDRNDQLPLNIRQAFGSPSSRRAWIEISIREHQRDNLPSPSSRRAWIEIFTSTGSTIAPLVALLAEGVDRNFAMMGGGGLWGSRPPRGGRG